jgi:hypothetical protein
MKNLPCKSETSIAASYLLKDVPLFTISVPFIEAKFRYPYLVTGLLEVMPAMLYGYSFRSLSCDRSTASSKVSSPDSAI